MSSDEQQMQGLAHAMNVSADNGQTDTAYSAYNAMKDIIESNTHNSSTCVSVSSDSDSK